MKHRITIALLATLILVSCAKQPFEVKGDAVLLNFALSPNGDRVVVFDNTGVYIYELNSKNRFELSKFDDKSFSDSRSGAVAFSPNGEQIAFSGKFADQSIDIREIKSNKHITSIEPPSGNYVTEIEFSPNGQSLIVRSLGSYGNRGKVSCESLVDTLTLFNLETGSNIFEISQCAFLPIQFSFTANNKLFFYQGTMTPEYFIYFTDSNTGQLISTDKLNWDEDGNLYNVSPDGKFYFVEKSGFTYLLDSVSEKEVKVVEGDIIFFHNIDNFIVSDFKNNKSNFVKNDETRCTFEGIAFAPHALIKRKASVNQEVFAISLESNTNLQVWDISSCEKIAEFLFGQ